MKQITEGKPYEWQEIFSGHYFLSGAGAVRVRVDARGPNIMHPVGIIDMEFEDGYQVYYYEEFDTLGGALSKTKAVYLQDYSTLV